MRTPRLITRTVLGLAGTALLLPLLAAPAEARPELPAVVPGDLARADQVVVDVEATLAAAVDAETQAAARRDSAAAALETSLAALAEVDADLAEVAQSLREAERRAALASERVVTAGVAARAAAAARDLQPVVLAGAGAGAAGVIGLLGHSMAAEPLAAGAEERAVAARAEAADAVQEVHRLRAASAELLGRRRTASGDVAAAEQAHLATVVEVDRTAAATRSTRSASTAAAAEAQALRETIAVDTRLVRPGTGETSSPFGTRRHPVTGLTKLHSGADFLPGDGVAYAAAAGTVASVDHDPAYGLIVVVAHGTVDGAPVTTAYAHLAQAQVAPGQPVTPGQPVGRIGNSGLSTGPHLHFEIRVADAPVDPASWLGG